MLIKKIYFMLGANGSEYGQCYAEKQALQKVSLELLETQVNPAVWEISGHMVLKRRKDYDDASEEYAWKLLSEVSLSVARFEKVKAHVSVSADLKVEMDDCNINQKEGICNSQAPQVASRLHQDGLMIQ